MVIAVTARDTGIWHECHFAWANPIGRPGAAKLVSDDSPSWEATGVRLSAGFVPNVGPPLP